MTEMKDFTQLFLLGQQFCLDYQQLVTKATKDSYNAYLKMFGLEDNEPLRKFYDQYFA